MDITQSLKDMNLKYCKGLRVWGVEGGYPPQLSEEEIACTLLSNATDKANSIIECYEPKVIVKDERCEDDSAK